MSGRAAVSAGALALLVVLSGSGPVAAASARDQYQLSHVDDGAPFGRVPVAQMFTVNMNGWLSAVSVYLSVTPDPSVPAADREKNYNVDIAVYGEGDPGKPNMNLGAEAMYALVTVPAQPGWRTVSFPGSFPHYPAISVIAGQRFAIVVSAGQGWLFDWPGVCGSDVYAGGAAYIAPDWTSASVQTLAEWRAANPGSDPRACQQDMAFQTFVSSTRPTAPATGTAAPENPAPSGGALPLMLAGFALAAAYVTVRKVERVRGL